MDGSSFNLDGQPLSGVIPLTELGKPPNPYRERLEGVFAEFSPNPRMWVRNSVLIDAVAKAVPDADRSLFVEALVDGVFTKFSENEKALEEVYFGQDELPDGLAVPALAQTQLRWSRQEPSEYVTLFWKNTLKTAVRLDKQMTLDMIAKYQDFLKADFIQGYMATVASEFPFMGSADMLIDPKNYNFRYHNQDIKLDQNNPLALSAYKAREITYGKALLLEDRDGKPLAILHPPLFEASRQQGASAEILDVQEYHNRYSYGTPVNLTEIKALLDDPDFAASLDFLSETNLNQTTFPMYAKTRLRSMYQEEQNQPHIRKLFENYNFQALSLFQLFEGSELMETVQTFNDYAEKGRKKAATSILEETYIIGEFASVYTGQSKTENPMMAELLEGKLTGQLREFVTLSRDHSQNLGTEDLAIISGSFKALSQVAEMAVKLAKKEDISGVIKDTDMSPRFILDLFEFSGKHKHASTIFQTAFDYAMCVSILRQRDSPYAGKIAQLKDMFYKKYNEGNKMNAEAVTTDTVTDVARAASIVEHLVNSKELPQNMRILLGGCGNCQRFELPFIRRLKEHGVDFSSIVGVDGTDFTSEMPPELQGNPNFKFMNMNLEDPKLKAEGKFDVVVLPWSVINDMVEKKGLMAALQVFKGLVKDGGILLTDQPLPIGKHSYFDTLNAQADLWGVWGIMERDFDLANGDQVRSIFDIMHVRELIMHGLHAGFIPVNFPLDPSLQQRICEAISKDDSVLTRIHTSGQDHDAFRYPFWQSSTYWNRSTMGWRLAGEKEIQRYAGFTPSILVKALYG